MFSRLKSKRRHAARLPLAEQLEERTLLSFAFSKVADTATPIPGGTGTFSQFAEPSIDGSRVAFWGKGTDRSGIYLASGGQIQTVVDSATAIPGHGGQFGNFDAFSLDAGSVVFDAIGGSPDGIIHGIYANIGGQLQTIADNKMRAPGHTGNFIDFVENSIKHNKVAFVGISISDQTGLGDKSIYTWENGTLTTIADFGTIIPGTTSTFSSFREVALDDNGDVAFLGGDSSVTENSGIYLYTNGQIKKILDVTVPVPGGAGQVGSVQKLAFDHGTLVFQAVTTANVIGLYKVSSGNLQVVADTNTQIPDNSGNFLYFDRASVDSGDVAYTAEVHPNIHTLSVYLSHAGKLTKVLAPSDPLDGKTVQDLTLRREALKASSLAVRVEFTDGTQGIYRTDFGGSGNRAPVANNDVVTVPYNGSQTFDVLANDSDPDGTKPTTKNVSKPKSGTLTPNADGTFTYTPTTGFTGQDNFTYQAFDGSLYSNVVTVTITVSLPPAVLPDIIMTKATTVDARSVTIDFKVSSADINQPVTFSVFRSATTTLSSSAIPFKSVTIYTPLPQNVYPNVRLDFGADLVPDIAHPYVIVKADPGGTITESDESNNSIYFKKFILGVVTHGLTIGVDDQRRWISQMAAGLKAGGYSDTLVYDWISTSSTPFRNQALIAGNGLAAKVLLAVNNILRGSGHNGDVVDVHFIGHSRGAAVISQALLTISKNPPANNLGGSYIKVTLLDPHPARNYQSQIFYSVKLDNKKQPDRIASVLYNYYYKFQQSAVDNQVIIPANVKSLVIYYQHTQANVFTSLPQSLLNLWGENSDKIGHGGTIVNLTGRPLISVDLTGVRDQILGFIGHSEVPVWYQIHIVQARKTL